MRLNNWERVLFSLISLMLGGFYLYSQINSNVWQSIYFYRNSLAFLHTTPDWITFLNTGFIANTITMLQLQYSIPSFITFVIVGLLSFATLRSLYLYFVQTLPKQFSLLLLLLIFLTPIYGEFRQALSSPLEASFYGFLFALFPYPFLMLAGTILVLTSLNRDRLSRQLSINRALGLSFILYLLHPFLFAVFVVSFIAQARMFKNRKIVRFGFWSQKIFIVLFFLSLLAWGIFLWVNFHAKFLGAFTIEAPSNFNSFEIITYIFVPIVLLLLSLFLVNISLYEIVSKFIPILTLFLIETGLVTLSLISGRNFLLFLSINGLDAILHVLYFVPSIYVALSVSRRQRIKWIYFEKLGELSEKLISNWLPKIAVVLTLILFSITLKNNVEYLNRQTECRDAKYIERLVKANLGEIELKQMPQALLANLQVYTLKDTSFSAFMGMPHFNRFLYPTHNQICSIDGLGYLISNGFTFYSSSLGNANKDSNSRRKP